MGLRASPSSSSGVFLLPVPRCQGFQMAALGPCCLQGWQPLRDCKRSHKKIVLANLKVRSPIEHIWSWKEHCLNADSSWSGSYLSWRTCCLHMPNICLLEKKHFPQQRQGHGRSQPCPRLLQGNAPGAGCCGLLLQLGSAAPSAPQGPSAPRGREAQSQGLRSHCSPCPAVSPRHQFTCMVHYSPQSLRAAREKQAGSTRS